ncbi:GIY-YIG nuclease family protein [Paraflavitalea speifideaquila]|uniref:GIY-YIG nuclease family protein n=1 Tax=Paraflavitalea speifideaquila TaxID=3076558 RepID=UPI0028E26E4D|nr:GIY-YIG nuclease family protein [Paraflavitalea speifideiaquila]
MPDGFFVYILYSEELDRYYIGVTADVEERLRKHLANHKGFTGKAADWSVRLTEYYPDKATALKREKQLKGWKNRLRIEELIHKSSQQASS